MSIPKNMPRTVLIDQYRLAQVFLNLVNNSLRFTDTGSINISIQWRKNVQNINEQCFMPYPYNDADDQDEGLFEKTSAFAVLQDNLMNLDTSITKIKYNLESSDMNNRGVLKVTISDTGCGMSKEQMSQLFQKFSQVSTDSSKRKLGTGLGLFISQQLCQKMMERLKYLVKRTKAVALHFVFQ